MTLKAVSIVLVTVGYFMLYTISFVESNVISRGKRNSCQLCSDDPNFNTLPYCKEFENSECCRVCEKGEYRRSTDCYMNEDHDEYQFRCDPCGQHTYQDVMNIDAQCKTCTHTPPPCAEGKRISDDCHKWDGNYDCVSVPSTPSSTSKTSSSSGNDVLGPTTKKSFTSGFTPTDLLATSSPENSLPGSIKTKDNTGMIVGIVCTAIILIVLCVAYGCYKRHQNFRNRVNGFFSCKKKVQGQRGSQNHTSADVRSELLETAQSPNGASTGASDNASPNDRADKHYQQLKIDSTSPCVEDENVQRNGQDIPSSSVTVQPSSTLNGPDADDSHFYVLKDGDNKYGNFVIRLANILPPDKPSLYNLYNNIKLQDHDYKNAEHGKDAVEGKLAVLELFKKKIGKSDDERVQILLTGMWKANLMNARQKIIEECLKIKAKETDC